MTSCYVALRICVCVHVCACVRMCAGEHMCVLSRGGTIHRCIDTSRYFSRDTYRDIIFYNHNFFCFFLLSDSFRQKRYIIHLHAVVAKYIH